MRRAAAQISLAAMLTLALSAAHASAAAGDTGAGTKRIAIVIDDLGNNMAGTEEIMSAPFRLTVAVMPFLPTTKRDAEWAHRVGHDVIVHLPMEPLRGRRNWLGPGAIMTDLADDEIRRRVEAAIDEVPYAVGVNNHMGSKVTADERVMRIVLDVCKKRGLFFLDSKTHYRSVVSRIGSELGVPVLQNQIFLDDIASTAHISRQFELIRKQVDEQRTCIAIGHVGIPGKKTAAVLIQSAPTVSGDTQFVRLSEMVQTVSQSRGK
ncbi:divergent polysaccharide deacetylase family protein [Paenibacillus mesophilus]|nr:divergent polysaccharide deacetylase family protein [Paenibacillus mesophilus]